LNRLVIASFLALLLLLLPVLPAQAVSVGSPAPDFTLADLDGKTVHLADYKGRIVLLKLATTWCPSCRQQSQELHDALEVLKRFDVVVIEVFLQDSETMVRNFLGEPNLRLPGAVAVIDDDQVRRRYNVYTIPRVLLLDRDLTIRRDGGLWPTKELSKAIEQLGAGTKP